MFLPVTSRLCPVPSLILFIVNYVNFTRWINQRLNFPPNICSFASEYVGWRFYIKMLNCSIALLQIVPISKCNHIFVLIEKRTESISLRFGYDQNLYSRLSVIIKYMIYFCTFSFCAGQPFCLSHCCMKPSILKKLVVCFKCFIRTFHIVLPFYRITQQEE